MAITASLVVTTIFDPVLLDDYAANFRRHGHLDDVRVFVVPDRKTPREAYDRCARLAGAGLRVECPGLDAQEAFLRKVAFPPEEVPYNSDNRRNVGYLMALEAGTDIIISIDDDNYCRPGEDYLAEHAVVAADAAEHRVVRSDTGWYNACSLLELDRPGTTYPRGFPYFARHRGETVESTTARARVDVNAGLWLGDPDVDGITWLVSPAHATAHAGGDAVLAPDTWCAVNTQNTALRREAMAAYYFLRMGYPLQGTPIDRYGDIFSGYFVQACARTLGGAVRFGTPVAEHRRNSHDYMRDATNEWACIAILEELLPWLIESELDGTTYAEAYTALADALEAHTAKASGRIWNDATRSYFRETAASMRAWAATCRTMG